MSFPCAHIFVYLGMKKTPKTPAFKPYDQHQMFLFPPSIEDMIPQNHPVRLLNMIFDKLNYRSLFARYPGGGTSSYNPAMLVKVLVYAYLNNIYSSRRIEALLKENIHFMWLSGMQQPDHNTINRFRKEKLRRAFKDIFIQVVQLLMEQQVVSIKEVYLDGTKLEANAHKYSFVWGNAIKTSEGRIIKQLNAMWDYIQEQTVEADREEFPLSLGEIDAGRVEETIKEINRRLAGAPEEVPKKLKQKLKYAEKMWPEKFRQYSKHKEILGTRKSYSKTDPDATFMRMKEDHMKNSELKAGYNVGVATNNGIVIEYGIYQSSTDTTTLPDMVEGIQESYPESPEFLIADAGYGSEENYTFLQQAGIKGVIKHGRYDSKKKRLKKRPFESDALYYNPEKDCVICPMGQTMERAGTRTRKTDNGFTLELSLYKAVNCEGCPVRGICHRGTGERVVELSHRGRDLRKQAEELLTSEEGAKLYAKRKTDVEPVFGNIKQNKKFRRFTLRGLEGVWIEFGLVALSHNLGKVILGNLLKFTPSFA